MRVGTVNDGISVHAISSSHVVLVGLDCTETADCAPGVFSRLWR